MLFALAALPAGRFQQVGFTQDPHEHNQFVFRELIVLDAKLTEEHSNLCLLCGAFKISGCFQSILYNICAGGIRGSGVGHMVVADRPQDLHQILADSGPEEVILRKLRSLDGLHVDIIRIGTLSRIIVWRTASSMVFMS